MNGMENFTIMVKPCSQYDVGVLKGHVYERICDSKCLINFHLNNKTTLQTTKRLQYVHCT